jgi:hypothetical protein
MGHRESRRARYESEPFLQFDIVDFVDDAVDFVRQCRAFPADVVIVAEQPIQIPDHTTFGRDRQTQRVQVIHLMTVSIGGNAVAFTAAQRVGKEVQRPRRRDIGACCRNDPAAALRGLTNSSFLCPLFGSTNQNPFEHDHFTAHLQQFGRTIREQSQWDGLDGPQICRYVHPRLSPRVAPIASRPD